jgi:hypothetical protein
MSWRLRLISVSPALRDGAETAQRVDEIKIYKPGPRVY